MSFAKIKLKNKLRHALCDSGASASLISPSIIKDAGLTKSIVMGDTYHLKGAFPGGETVPCGEITIPFFINKKQYVHTFIVAELSGDTEIILGEDFFCQHESKCTNNYGCKTLWLNGQKVPLTTSKLVKEGETVKTIPYLPPVEVQKCVNKEVFLYRKQKILPKARLIVKVELPQSIKDSKVMLEALGSREIDFADQITAVRTAKAPGKHFKNGCRYANCAGCTPYQFAYLEIVNLTSKTLTISKNRPIALASEFTKVPKEDLVKINQVSIEEPEYAEKERIMKIFNILKGKSPDFPEKEEFLQTLVTEFPQAFHLDGERLSVTDAMMHHINYEGPPIWHRQRPIPQAKLPGLLKSIDKLILHGSIGASDSPYNFQTVPVYKHGTDDEGERAIRLTVDLSPLNRLTSRDRVTIPTWDEISAKLGNAKIFSKIDLKSAFH